MGEVPAFEQGLFSVVTDLRIGWEPEKMRVIRASLPPSPEGARSPQTVASTPTHSLVWSTDDITPKGREAP